MEMTDPSLIIRPVDPTTAVVASLILGGVWGLLEVVRCEWRPPRSSDYGSVDPDWWVDRAKKGGGR